MKTVFVKAFITIFTLIFTVSFFHPYVNAEDVRGTLDNIEAERREKIEQEILLDLPEISDNPNHIITFKDPSGNGVQLEIDGQGFKKIESPYTLPSLGLGRHTLIFKFTDKEETQKTLERSLTIIPRAPIIKPPEINGEDIKVNGTAMPNSEVNLFLTNKTINKEGTTNVTPEGNWEYTFNNEIKEGTYTVIGVTRSRGFASHYSEPLVFSVGEDKKVENPSEEESIFFSFGQLNLRQPREAFGTLLENRDLLIAFVVFLAVGFLGGLFLISIINRISHNRSKKTLKEIIEQKNNPEIVTPLSFKDRLSGLRKRDIKDAEEEIAEEIREELEEEEEKEEQAKEDLEKKFLEEEVEVEEKGVEEKNEEEEQKEEERKSSLTKKINPVKEEEEEKETEKDKEEEAPSISREEFLEKYKDFDPDDEDGIEKQNRNIKISLTSKD
jgi:hypothetical protein